MDNPFDQFDAQPAQSSGNPFDQFDATAPPGAAPLPTPASTTPAPGAGPDATAAAAEPDYTNPSIYPGAEGPPLSPAIAKGLVEAGGEDIKNIARVPFDVTSGVVAGQYGPGGPEMQDPAQRVLPYVVPFEGGMRVGSPLRAVGGQTGSGEAAAPPPPPSPGLDTSGPAVPGSLGLRAPPAPDIVDAGLWGPAGAPQPRAGGPATGSSATAQTETAAPAPSLGPGGGETRLANFPVTPDRPVRVVFPDGSSGNAIPVRYGAGGNVNAIEFRFDGSDGTPAALQGKTTVVSPGMGIRLEELPPSGPPSAAPAPTLQQVLDDSRSVNEIRAENGATATPPEQPPPSTSGTVENPTVVRTAADLHGAVQEIDHEASPAQKAAGNYPKAHILWSPVEGQSPLPITLETAQGRQRTATDGSWSVTMPAHYGYVLGTRGADTEPGGPPEQVDVFLGNAPQSGKAWVVDQIDPATKEFDEHKILAAFPSRTQAVNAYNKAFSDGSGPSRVGAVTEMDFARLQAWLASGDTSKPIAYTPPAAAPASASSSGTALPGAPPAPAGGPTPAPAAALVKVGDVFDLSGRRYRLDEADGERVVARDLTGPVPVGRVFRSRAEFERLTGRALAPPQSQNEPIAPGDAAAVEDLKRKVRKARAGSAAKPKNEVPFSLPRSEQSAAGQIAEAAVALKVNLSPEETSAAAMRVAKGEPIEQAIRAVVEETAQRLLKEVENGGRGQPSGASVSGNGPGGAPAPERERGGGGRPAEAQPAPHGGEPGQARPRPVREPERPASPEGPGGDSGGAAGTERPAEPGREPPAAADGGRGELLGPSPTPRIEEQKVIGGDIRQPTSTQERHFVDETPAARTGLGARRDHVAMRSYLLSRERADGFEHTVVVMDGKIAAAGTSEQPRFVMIPPDLAASLADPKAALDVRHNHPNGSALSTGDINCLGYPGIARIVSYDGGAFAASLTPKANAWLDGLRPQSVAARIAAIARLTEAAYRAIYTALMPAFVSGMETSADLNFIHGLALGDALEAIGLVAYDRHAKPTDSRLNHELRAIAKRQALKDLRWIIDGAFDFEALRGISDRPAVPVRQHERDRGVPRPDVAASAGLAGSEGGGALGEGSTRPEPKPGLSEETPYATRAAAREGPLAGAVASAKALMREATRAAQMQLVPMAVEGESPERTETARTIATDWANNNRLAYARWARTFDRIEKEFPPAARALMGIALEEQSVYALRGEAPPEGRGLARLDERQRAVVDRLDQFSEYLHGSAVEAGMLPEDHQHIPYYFPRMAVLLLAEGGIGRIPEGGAAGRDIEQFPTNIRTTTANLKRRKYELPEETERALNASLEKRGVQGRGALVKDILVLPFALMRLERAIAGRALVNGVKAAGQMVGQEWVSDAAHPGWFTINDHPAFYKWKLRGFEPDPEREGRLRPIADDEGNPIYDRTPLHIHPDFKGPLTAIFLHPNGPIYRALIALKSRVTMGIMYSPLIHNMVELGRAFPLMPGQFIKLRLYGGWMPLPSLGTAYRVGYRARQDDEFMDYLVAHGLVPMSRQRGHVADVTDIAELPLAEPGRGLVAQGVRAALTPMDVQAARAAARAVDRFGDFWHKTLLWDRIADLQAGIAKYIMDDMIAEGHPRPVAARTAAHIANRFAGAMPQEAMSQFARKLFNVLLFSRTFTLGNLAVFKDALTGLPRGTQAQIKRDLRTFGIQAEAGGGGAGAGEPPAGGAGAARDEEEPDEAAIGAANRKVRRYARRLALAAIVTDLALHFIMDSVLQNFFDHFKRGESWGEIADGYMRRLAALGDAALRNPFDVLNPIHDLEHLTPMWDNEKTKRDRIYVGRAADGTGIYVINPIGRLGYEFASWMTVPLDLAKRKLSTLIRPLLETFPANDRGFDRKVYDPDDNGLLQVGEIAWNWIKNQIPLGPLGSLAEFMADPADKAVTGMKFLGPLLGVSVSTGYPGGPEFAELSDLQKRQGEAVRAAWPDLEKQVQAGDLDGATSRMEALGMSKSQIRTDLQRLQNPESRFTKGRERQIETVGTPEEQGRIARDRAEPGAGAPP